MLLPVSSPFETIHKSWQTIKFEALMALFHIRAPAMKEVGLSNSQKEEEREMKERTVRERERERGAARAGHLQRQREEKKMPVLWRTRAMILRVRKKPNRARLNVNIFVIRLFGIMELRYDGC